jgi:rare lipoprotein A
MTRVLPSLMSLVLVLALSACSSSPPRTPSEPGTQATGRSPIKSGGYYKDDGPGENPPDLDRIGDAQPRPERLHRFANNPYQVFGKDYVPLRTAGPFRERGMASWYGRRYHGQKTSNGEIYDMYGMTAAHPTLPIPSYARVTNAASGRSVVVRINDRGPFLGDRVIDLSYVAAHKLGYVQSGSTLVDVESIPTDGRPADAAPVQPTAAFSPAVPAVAPLPASTDSAGGIYLQLGAFSVRDNAETFRAKLNREFEWLAEGMRVDAQGSLFRLQLGPYRSQEEARRIAERIQNELNLRPVLTVR